MKTPQTLIDRVMVLAPHSKLFCLEFGRCQNNDELEAFIERVEAERLSARLQSEVRDISWICDVDGWHKLSNSIRCF